MPAAILRHAVDHGRRAGLLLDRVLVVALQQGVLLEIGVCAAGRVSAVEADRQSAQSPVRPTWPQVVMSAKPLLRVLEKMPSSCGKRQAVDRVVLVHVDGQAVQRHADPRRLEAMLLLEGVLFLGLHLARHRAELGGAPVKAGGAVAEPLPSTWILTFG